MSKHMNPQMEECIKNCQECHHVCLETAMNHCLETGGNTPGPRTSGS